MQGFACCQSETPSIPSVHRDREPYRAQENRNHRAAGRSFRRSLGERFLQKRPILAFLVPGLHAGRAQPRIATCLCARDRSWFGDGGSHDADGRTRGSSRPSLEESRRLKLHAAFMAAADPSADFYGIVLLTAEENSPSMFAVLTAATSKYQLPGDKLPISIAVVFGEATDSCELSAAGLVP
jgi:hypothetical protein